MPASSLQPTERFIEIVVQGQTARGPEEFNSERTKMKATCNKCHAEGFVNEHFKASDEIIKAADQASLRPRERFWDIQVPKIDSAFDSLLVPRTSWSPTATR